MGGGDGRGSPRIGHAHADAPPRPVHVPSGTHADLGVVRPRWVLILARCRVCRAGQCGQLGLRGSAGRRHTQSLAAVALDALCYFEDHGTCGWPLRPSSGKRLTQERCVHRSTLRCPSGPTSRTTWRCACWPARPATSVGALLTPMPYPVRSRSKPVMWEPVAAKYSFTWTPTTTCTRSRCTAAARSASTR